MRRSGSRCSRHHRGGAPASLRSSVQHRRCSHCSCAIAWSPIEMFGDKTLEAIKVPVLRQEPGDTVLTAEGHDLRIEDEVADCVRFTNRFHQECRVGRAGYDHPHAGRREQSRQRLARLVRGVGRIEQPWVGYDTNEFPDAENGNRPAGRRLRKCHDTSKSSTVLGRLFSVGVNENVGIDGYQPGASIRS